MRNVFKLGHWGEVGWAAILAAGAALTASALLASGDARAQTDAELDALAQRQADMQKHLQVLQQQLMNSMSQSGMNLNQMMGTAGMPGGVAPAPSAGAEELDFGEAQAGAPAAAPPSAPFAGTSAGPSGAPARPASADYPSAPGLAGRFSNPPASASMPVRSPASAPPAARATPDAASAQAAAQTIDLLNQPAARNAYIQKDAAAAKADAQVDKLTSDPAVKQGIYGLSSDVFNELYKRTGGDPAKMMEELEKAKKDPAGFAASWSPETQKKLRALSGQVEAPSAQSK